MPPPLQVEPVPRLVHAYTTLLTVHTYRQLFFSLALLGGGKSAWLRVAKRPNDRSEVMSRPRGAGAEFVEQQRRRIHDLVGVSQVTPGPA